MYSSRQQNKSKSSYQGQQLTRMPRSELEDATMRDLNRYDNRLDHNLKHVDKAREVMLKSLESDRHIFLKGGAARNNKRYTSTHSQNAGDARQRKEVTSYQQQQQQNKYHSDTRNKKSQPRRQSSIPEYDVTHDDVNNNNNNINNTSNNNNNNNNNSSKIIHRQPGHSRQERNMLSETEEIVGKLYGEELVEEYLNSISNGASMEKVVGSSVFTPLARPGSSSWLSQQITNEPGASPAAGGSSTSTSVILAKAKSKTSTIPTTTITKKSDYQSGDASLDSNIEESNSKGNIQEDGVNRIKDGDFTFFDEYCSYGRKPGYWDYLSTPKNPSGTLQKRQELEREFSSASLKPRATTPASNKSARVTPATPSDITPASSSSSSPHPSSTTTKTTTTKSTIATTATNISRLKSATRKKALTGSVQGAKSTAKAAGKGKEK